MRTLLLYSLLICCVLAQVSAARERRRRKRSMCITEPRLRDKWHIVGENRRVSIRIRSQQIVYRHGSATTIKFRCIESRGNIYLLRKRKYIGNDDGVLCMGFSYVADHPRGEYAILRLIGHGEGSSLMSPVIMPRRSRLSINSTCDLEGRHTRIQPEDHYVTNGFIRRSSPGCKFPASIQGRWNFTYQHAKSLEIWQRNSTLHLMDGTSVKFLCDKRDGKVFVFRSRRYVSADEDAIMCVEFTPMEDDPFYTFEVSRHNSGTYLDAQLKAVSKSETIYVHIHCDWIGSPARPEFLYP